MDFSMEKDWIGRMLLVVMLTRIFEHIGELLN